METLPTKTLFVQIESANKEVIFVLTNAPSDGEARIQNIQPDVPINTIHRKIHATEASEYIAFFNSDEAHNEGTKATDIREIARLYDKNFIEADFAEGFNDVRYQYSFVRLHFRPGGSRAKIRDPPPYFGA